MQENNLSRYGTIARPIDVPIGAKLFIVSDSDDTTVGPANIANEFPVDRDGVVRVYTTIQAAANAATAGRGDVVAVLPGYDHTLSRADSWSTAGVKVLGYGEGLSRPILRYTAATDEVGVAANNVTIENVRFIADVTAIARAIDLDTGFSGATIRRCIFDFNATGEDFKNTIRVGQARTTIEDNYFIAEDTTGAAVAIQLFGGYGDYTTIRRNKFYGQYDTNGDTTNGGGMIGAYPTHDSGDTTLHGLDISDNKFISTDTAATVVINLGAGAVTIKGAAIDNRIAVFDTAVDDSSVISSGTAATIVTVYNWVKTGDSDESETLVSQQAKFVGIQDS